MKTWTRLIEYTWKQKIDRNWDSLYWIIDLHDTVITGVHNKFNDGAVLYPFAQETLDYLYKHTVHKSILWTSSHDQAVDHALKKFDIKFNYINMNPECPSTELCNFNTKLYFNFVLDDKAAFDPNNDWLEILTALKNIDNRK